MTCRSPFRLGFFSYLEGHGDVRQTYAEALELFAAAESFGFDTAWVAQHHFGHHGGLPSPLVFFSALAAKTTTIHVGTAVISLPFEHPLRLAEDAAVFDTIFPGRLHLGLGTGFGGEAVLEAFNKAGGDRRELYDEAIERVLCSLEGAGTNRDNDKLHPAAPGLRQRIWEAPSTLPRVEEAARRGSGLLLSRVAIGVENVPTHQVQIPMVELYKKTLQPGIAPRIGLSRTIYPARDPDSAVRNLSAGIAAANQARARQGLPVPDRTFDDQVTKNNIHTGLPVDVAESVRREPLFEQITDLICQVQPGQPSFKETLEAIELIATEVAPALGWSPSK